MPDIHQIRRREASIGLTLSPNVDRLASGRDETPLRSAPDGCEACGRETGRQFDRSPFEQRGAKNDEKNRKSTMKQRPCAPHRPCNKRRRGMSVASRPSQLISSKTIPVVSIDDVWLVQRD